MTFNHDTCIEACDADEGQNIPQVQFNFIPISEIANRSANSTCGKSKFFFIDKSLFFENSMFLDVIAVVKSTSDMQTIVSKASQKEFSKRELLLVDEQASISATLWGQQVQMIVIQNRFDRFFLFSFRQKNLMVYPIQLWLSKELKLEILMVEHCPV